MMLDKSILVTGGTGSFGSHFVRTILGRRPDIKRLVVYSRDELKQSQMAQQFPREKYPGLRFFIGDIRDENRLWRALEGIDIVVHAAALKHVPIAEYNPFECIKTNILGAQNLIEVCLDRDVKRVVALSTDKAAAPVNLYGATKLCSDKLFVAANNIRGKRKISFSVVRYGNVMGSRGSVIPFFLEQRQNGILPITDSNMTRFNISLSESVDMVLWTIEKGIGGEIFVPKIPSYRIVDLAVAIGPHCEHRIVGIRPGEKLHEELITVSDSQAVVDFGGYFAVLSSSNQQSKEQYCGVTGAIPTSSADFSYNSRNNTFLSVDELRTLIRSNVDPNFTC